MTKNYSNQLFSIIIPVYNGYNYLTQSIHSALTQTYSNIEIIVVNDGSCDKNETEKVALSFKDKIRYFNKPNGGVASALNFALEKMEGDYFVWLSHDDLLAENRIEEDFKFFSCNPGTLISYCRIKEIDDKGKILKEKEILLDQVNNPIECLQLGGVDMCSMTIHKSCFNQVGIFNTMNKTMQDVEMTLRLSRNFKFLFNPNTYFCKRIHKDMGTIKYIEQHKIDQIALFDFLGNNFTLKDFYPELNFNNKDNLYTTYLNLGKLFAAWQSYSHADRFYSEAYILNKRFFSFPFLMKLFGTKHFYVFLQKNFFLRTFRKILKILFP